MKSLKNASFSFLALFIILGVLVGCSSDESKDSDVVTLKMVESLTSPERTKLLKEMLSDFQVENPDIKVELISPPLENADQKISQMLNAEASLDILEVRDQTLKQFSTNNYIEDLSPYIEDWDDWDSINENAKANAKFVDDTPYYVPYGLYQKVLFYRTDWFEEAGIDVPETWDDLYNAAKELTDPSKNRFGYSFRGGAGGQDYVEFTTWAYVGEDIDPEEGYFTKDGEPMFSTSEAKEGLEMFVDLYEDASPPDSISWSYPEMVEGFTSGVTAMLIQDPEVISVATDNMEEGTWDTAPLPKGPSGVAQQTVGAAGWGMTSYSEHKEEAWKLIQFLSEPDQNLHFAKNNSLIPIHKSAADDAFFSEGYFEPYIKMNEDMDVYKAVNRPIGYKGWGEFRGIQDKDIQSLLLGDLSIDEALDKWSEYWVEQKELKDE